MSKKKSYKPMPKDQFYSLGYHQKDFERMLEKDPSDAVLYAYREHCYRRKESMEKTQDLHPHYCRVCFTSVDFDEITPCCTAGVFNQEEGIQATNFRIKVINSELSFRRESKKLKLGGVDPASPEGDESFFLITLNDGGIVSAPSKKTLRRKLRKLGLSIRDFDCRTCDVP